MASSLHALIGYTGFIGSNLYKQHPFDCLYNSKNIEEIQGKQFDVVVCAAAPGVKWLANKEPANDLQAIEKLIENLKKIKAKKFILISTIDVYPQPSGTDEDGRIEKNSLQPYGKHRRLLEEFVESHFDSLIVRLPGLFGHGLKKNIIFDLMHRSYTFVNPKSILQFYYLEHLWNDITVALEQKLKLVNLVSEPLLIADIAEEVFDIALPNEIQGEPVHYDIHSKYAALWHNEKPYLYLRNVVLAELKKFTNTLTGKK